MDTLFSTKPLLAEVTCVSLINFILDNQKPFIAELESQMRAIFGSDKSSMYTISPFRADSAFISEQYKPFKTPALFVVPLNGSNNVDTAQNFVQFEDTYKVIAVCEGKDEQVLTRQCLRYVNILYRLLHDRTLKIGNLQHIHIKPTRWDSTPVLGNDKVAVFRKEVSWDLIITVSEDVQ